MGEGAYRPLDKAVAMLNMDMIGRIQDEKVYIGGVGTGSTFQETLTKAEDGFPFHIENSAGGYASSDHTSFVAKKIPVLFFFSGLHSDYHKPSDTWDKINAPDAARLLDMVAKVALNRSMRHLRGHSSLRLSSTRTRMRAWPAAAGAAATGLISDRFPTSDRPKKACASATCSRVRQQRRPG